MFTIDNLGNRTNVNVKDGSDVAYAVDELTNRYEAVDGNALDYDAAGNLIVDKDGYHYNYDYENRIARIYRIDGANEVDVVKYNYDSLGRRINKEDCIADTNTLYYYSNKWQVLAEYDKNQSYIQSYIWGNYIDELLVKTVGTMPYNLVHDHLHSPVALLHVLGSVMERYEYDAYGNPTIMDASYNARNSSNYGNNYLFTGRSVDILDTSSLKIQHNRNRSLDYYTGRWYSHDPLGITPNPRFPNRFDVFNQYTDGLNLYEYAKSDPMTDSDPQGLLGLLPITYPIIIANQSKACCKGTFGTQVYRPLPGGGAFPRRGIKRFEVTIPKRFDQTAQQACDCYSKKRKNVINIKEAYEGPCCTCKIYLESAPLPFFGHYRIRVQCKDESFTLEVGPDKFGAWDKTTIKLDINPYVGRPYFMVERCNVRCDQAKMWKSLGGKPWYYSDVAFPGIPGDGNCFQFAAPLYQMMCSSQ